LVVVPPHALRLAARRGLPPADGISDHVEQTHLMTVAIAMQASPRDMKSWTALAHRVEGSGFHALLIGDHPGSGPSPWPSLGAAAAATSTLNLGTYVLQTGVADPISVAANAATLDLLAPGRVLLGLGAGHTFREWEATGLQRPSTRDRVGRLLEFATAVERLLDGQTVTVDGRYLTLAAAQLDDLPVGKHQVRLVVGGSHHRILALAAEHANVVALSGLGRTHPDGHRHEVRWSFQTLTRQLELIRSHAERAGSTPAIEALVQVVIVTNERRRTLAELADRIPDASVGDLQTTPYVLVGTVEQMADQLHRQAESLGITQYVVREDAIEPIGRVLAQLDR
jgi:probable F420-dependent oxidoreductase